MKKEGEGTQESERITDLSKQKRDETGTSFTHLGGKPN